MKRLALFVALMLAAASWGVPVLGAGDVTPATSKVNGCTVKMVNIKPGLVVKPVLANNRTGQTANLQDMAKSAGALAAVNGTFFCAYTPEDPVSWGTIMIDGVMERVGASGGALGITDDGRVKVARLRTTIKGGLNGSEQWPNNWSAWDVNLNSQNPDSVVIFTPKFGQKMVSPTGTTITVRQGVVKSIQKGTVPIPADGYVIGFGPGSAEYAARFSVGDTVQVHYEFRDHEGNLLDWSDVRHIIQAGPLLVQNGQNVLNTEADRINEPKFQNRGSWSFVGCRDNDSMVIGTVSGGNMKQMAETLTKAGLKHAIGLDGGASVGLYCQDKLLIKPGRKLSNCLAVVKPADTVPRAADYKDAMVTQKMPAVNSDNTGGTAPAEEPGPVPGSGTGNEVNEPEQPGKSLPKLTDINSHWAQKTIEELVATGAISGYPDGTFKPNRTVTRAEFATILVKAWKLESDTGKVCSDTSQHWAKDSIAVAAAHGIVNGYSDSTFGPNDNITREQMALMIARAAKLDEVAAGKPFVDSMKISTWARDAAAATSKDGIITGYPDSTFRPQANTTRAEAATVIVRALKSAE